MENQNEQKRVQEMYEASLAIINQYPAASYINTLLPNGINDLLPLIKQHLLPIRSEIDTYDKCFNKCFAALGTWNGMVLYTIRPEELQKLYGFLRELLDSI